MGSINISLNEHAYAKLKRLKKKNESFSQAVVRLADEKDISKCYGILNVSNAELAAAQKAAAAVRSAKWRGALF